MKNYIELTVYYVVEAYFRFNKIYNIIYFIKI